MDAGVYLISGKLGTGKGLHAVSVIRNYLSRGRYVLTNMDIVPEGLFQPHIDFDRLVRLPDFPSEVDFNNSTTLINDKYGVSCATKSKSYRFFGAIVLDELSVWMNSHNWDKPEVKRVRQWLINARKLGWNVYLITQHPDQIDKQTRESFIKFHVECHAVPLKMIPLVGTLASALLSKKFSEEDESASDKQIHWSNTRMGLSQMDKVLKRKFLFSVSHLYKGYDTNQVYQKDNPSVIASYSVLSPFKTKGRFMSKMALYKKVALIGVFVGLMVGAVLGFVIHSNFNQDKSDKKLEEKPELKIDSDYKVIGSYQVGNSKFFTISHSGSIRSYSPKHFTETQDGVCINEENYRFGPGCL